MAIRQEANSPLIITVGVISALLLLVIIFGVQAWFTKEEHDEIAGKWEVSKNEQLESLFSEQRSNINRKGPTSMPIDDAIKAVAAGKLRK